MRWRQDAKARAKNIFIFFATITSAFILLYLYSYVDWMNSPTETIVKATSTTSGIQKPQDAQKEAPPVSALKTLTPWKSVMTTLFWVGETADADNAYITNVASYWDEKWQEHYGGIDSPNCREGFLPCGFRPRENPFYFALPYAEYDESGVLKTSAATIPWAGKDNRALLKNRWIAVTHAGNTCYAQWQDVGPNGEDDYSYVFGTAKPINTFGVRAGLDVSPALWKCLQMSDNDVTTWAFVDESLVPMGPWKDTVTTSGISWED